MRELVLEWQDLWIPEYKPRIIEPAVFENKVKKINLFTGCRRVGKTYIMFQIIDHLNKKMNIERENIVYLNFEDERIEWKTEILTELLPTLVELYGERDYYLFLDEIHHIPKWDRWIRRIYDRYKNFNIYLTSSSSKLSSKKIPYSLRGRTLTYEVFPLSFREYASFNKFKLSDPKKISAVQRAKTLKPINEYLNFGGFPEVVLEPSERKKKSLVQDYFRTIIALDICERYHIKNISLIHDYIKLVLNQTYHSTNKTYNTLRSQGISVGKETLLNYTGYLEEIYFSFFVQIFSPKIKDRLYYPRKVYFVDNAFINHITTKFSDDTGRKMENAIYLTLLLKYGYENIFYWKNSKGYEIDFIILKDKKANGLIQVCQNPSETSIKEREIRSLLNGANELKCNNLKIITKNFRDKEKIDGYYIDFIPLYDWFYDEN